MVSVEMVQTLIMGGVVGVVLGSTIAFTFFKKKGVDVLKVLDTAEQVLDVAGLAIDLATKIEPNNPVINITKIIDEWAEKGVKGAQQLYYSNQLGNENRNTIAKNTVYTALKQFNITLDEEQQKLINITIEAAVNDLGHNKTELEKQAVQQ